MQKKSFIYLVLVLMLSATFSCNREKKITILYSEWSDGIAASYLMKNIIQKEYNMPVRLIPVSVAAMYQGVAEKEGDFMLTAWLPTTHSHYLKKVQNNVQDLGAYLHGTRIGLVVPEYSKAKQISDLKKYENLFKGKVIGIEPGAGIMEKTEKVISAYNLNTYRLISGSEPAMITELKSALENKKEIVITGWKPHWKFSRFQLRFLEDPKKIFGETEEIHVLARKGFEKDYPEIAALLKRFRWDVRDMESLMEMNEKKNADPDRNAEIWIKKHPALVKKWTDGRR